MLLSMANYSLLMNQNNFEYFAIVRFSKSSIIITIDDYFPRTRQITNISAFIYTLTCIKQKLDIDLLISLCISLFSGTQPCKPKYTCLPVLSVTFGTQAIGEAPTEFSQLYDLEVLTREQAGSIVRLNLFLFYFILFSFLKDHCPPFSDCQCIENVVLIYFYHVFLNLTKLSGILLTWAALFNASWKCFY